MIRQKTLERAARISALIEARDRGWLKQIRRADIARSLGFNRSAITRDFADMDNFERSKQKYLDALDAIKN